MSDPRFLPPKGKSEHHLASTDGHSCVIHLIDPSDEKRGTIVPERFRRLAVADGCGIVGLEVEDGDTAQKATKSDLIVAAIAAVMTRQLPEELEGDGRAKVSAVAKEAGFRVTKSQFEEAWPKFVDSLGADDEGGEGDGD